MKNEKRYPFISSEIFCAENTFLIDYIFGDIKNKSFSHKTSEDFSSQEVSANKETKNIVEDDVLLKIKGEQITKNDAKNEESNIFLFLFTIHYFI